MEAIMGLFRRKKKNIEVVEEKKTETKEEKVEKTEAVKTAKEKKPAKTENKPVTKKTVVSNDTKKETTKEKQDTSPAKNSAKKPIYRVMYDKENRVWLIKKDGAKRTIASYPTKEEALNRVRDLSSTNDLSFVVHKKDGKFQKKNNLK